MVETVCSNLGFHIPGSLFSQLEIAAWQMLLLILLPQNEYVLCYFSRDQGPWEQATKYKLCTCLALLSERTLGGLV